MNGEETKQLAKLTVKIEQLCRNVDKYYKENREEHKDIMDRIDKSTEKFDVKFIKADDDCEGHRVEIFKEMKDLSKNKMSSSMFKWVLGGLGGLILLGMIAVSGLAIDNKMNVHKMSILLSDHIAHSEIIFKQVTDKKEIKNEK